jgi:hypothetical protein
MREGERKGMEERDRERRNNTIVAPNTITILANKIRRVMLIAYVIFHTE